MTDPGTKFTVAVFVRCLVKCKGPVALFGGMAIYKTGGSDGRTPPGRIARTGSPRNSVQPALKGDGGSA